MRYTATCIWSLLLIQPLESFPPTRHHLLRNTNRGPSHEYIQQIKSATNSISQNSIAWLIVLVASVPVWASDDHTRATAIDLRFFAAGGLAASFSHGIATPADVIKTRIQASPDLFTGNSIINTTLSIISSDGPQVLLGGLGPTLVGYGFEGALKFGIYETLKPFLVHGFALMLGSAQDNTVSFLVSSVIAGAIASLVLCPMEATRIQIVTHGGGFFKTLSRITQDRVASIFYGLSPMLLKQVPYTMAKQVSFDSIASQSHAFFAAHHLLSQSDEFVIVPVISAIFASILACIFSHPGDVLLTMTYQNRSREIRFIDLITKLYSDQGLDGFFVGLSARFIHVGAIITSQLVVYDYVKQLLGLPATGT